MCLNDSLCFAMNPCSNYRIRAKEQACMTMHLVFNSKFLDLKGTAIRSGILQWELEKTHQVSNPKLCITFCKMWP